MNRYLSVEIRQICCLIAIFLFINIGSFPTFAKSNTEKSISPPEQPKENDNAELNNQQTKPLPPNFSLSSGFYNYQIILELSHPDPKAQIIFTTDGSEPTKANLEGTEYYYKTQYSGQPGDTFGDFYTNTFQSHIYEYPIEISDRTEEENKLAKIASSPLYNNTYIPEFNVQKATVVKARVYIDTLVSDVITNTYFVGNEEDFKSNLPIVSLSFNEDDFFDYYKGIYVPGEVADKWRLENPDSPLDWYAIEGNYTIRSNETERNATFQYFIDGKEVLNQNIGVRIHGNATRSFMSKSLRLYARSEYDNKNSFDYHIFGLRNSKNFKRLILRNSGNDFFYTLLRDAFTQLSVSHLNFDTQDYQPSSVYLNGEYWGILNIRERYDKHYFFRKYAIEEDDLDLISNFLEIEEGDLSNYSLMINYIANNDLTDSIHYNEILTRLDAENLIDYYITQTYISNADWPFNNTKFYRKRTNELVQNGIKQQDGRWRWLLFDTDFGMSIYSSNAYLENALERLDSVPPWSNFVYMSLLKNEDFKSKFINRYADLINTTFRPERLFFIFDSLVNLVHNEMLKHNQRWFHYSNWNRNLSAIRNFIVNRPAYALEHLKDYFNLKSYCDVRLNVSNQNAGYININSLTLRENIPGLETFSYPWNGTYFSDVPIKISATAMPGFQFTHWSGDTIIYESEIEVLGKESLNLTANFEFKGSDTPILLYFWMMDTSIPNDTPLEFLNSTYSVYNIPARLDFSSAFGSEYPFSREHQNWRKGSMERRNSPTHINYFEEGNNNLPYDEKVMRGIQIKQPFKVEEYENMMLFSFSTMNYKEIRVSFSAKDGGAAERILVDYFDDDKNQWTRQDLDIDELTLTDNYERFQLDLSEINKANCNENFKIRFRFDGKKIEEDNGKRVTFNNVAIEGIPFLCGNSVEQPNVEPELLIFPNPSEHVAFVKISNNLMGSEYEVFDTFGTLVASGIFNQRINSINLNSVASGVYILKLKDITSPSYKLIKIR